MTQGSIAQQVSSLKQAGYTGPSVEIDLRKNTAEVVMSPPKPTWFKVTMPAQSMMRSFWH